MLPGLLLCCLLAACGGKQKKLDTPTSVTITVVADETFSPLVDAEAEVFQSLYHKTKLNLLYQPENIAFQTLINDSARMIIAAREPNEAELAYFKKLERHLHTTPIATDAVALIVNRANPDSLFKMEQV